MTVYRCTACTQEFQVQPEVCTCGARSFATVPEAEPTTKPERDPEHKPHRGPHQR